MVSFPQLIGPMVTIQTEASRVSHLVFGIWPKWQSLSVAGSNVPMGTVGQIAVICARNRSGETTGPRRAWSRDSERSRRTGVGVWILRAVRPAPALSCSSILPVGSGRHSVSSRKINKQKIHFFLLRLVWFLLLAIWKSQPLNALSEMMAAAGRPQWVGPAPHVSGCSVREMPCGFRWNSVADSRAATLPKAIISKHFSQSFILGNGNGFSLFLHLLKCLGHFAAPKYANQYFSNSTWDKC